MYALVHRKRWFCIRIPQCSRRVPPPPLLVLRSCPCVPLCTRFLAYNVSHVTLMVYQPMLKFPFQFQFSASCTLPPFPLIFSLLIGQQGFLFLPQTVKYALLRRCINTPRLDHIMYVSRDDWGMQPSSIFMNLYKSL